MTTATLPRPAWLETVPDGVASIMVTGARRFPQELQPAVWERLDLIALSTFAGSLTLIHGGADGFDMMCDRWAYGRGVRTVPVLPRWDLCGESCRPGHRKVNGRGEEYCPQAGHRRNHQMVMMKPDVAVAGLMHCDRPVCNRGRKLRHITHGTADALARLNGANIPTVELRAWEL